MLCNAWFTLLAQLVHVRAVAAVLAACSSAAAATLLRNRAGGAAAAGGGVPTHTSEWPISCSSYV